MSAFTQGMDNLRENKLIPGENGTLELISTGESLVDLFFKVMRNMSADSLEAKLNTILRSVTSLESGRKADDTTLVDLFVMCMQTRDCRGGKGEREIFFQFFMLLAKSFPTTTNALIPLISHYGSYKDYFTILDIVNGEEDGLWANSSALVNMKTAILSHIADRLKMDESLIEKVKSGGKENNNPEEMYEVRKEVSLCAKYCPREGHSFWNKDKKENVECMSTLLSLLYPDSKANMRKQLYRKLCSSICSFLDITEQKMCGKRFADIVFKKVPSLCTKKYAKAFLNEKVKNNQVKYLGDQDRILCREHFIEHISSGKVKGGQLYPHQIVEKIFKDEYKMSAIDKELLKAQWVSMKETLIKQIEEAMKDGSAEEAHVTATTTSVEEMEVVEVEKKKEKGNGAIIDLGKLVALSDVSGSMHGTPMMVSIALGILISEMASPAFRNRVLTFETTPAWHKLEEGSSIVEKTKSLRDASWGGSTNLEAALDRIIEVCQNNKLGPEDIPDLIIFSDMQFDEADGSDGKGSDNRATQHERIVKKFHDVGIKICGKPYPAPRVIYWNLRSDTVGFPTEADAGNVQLLSGYSPSLFKAVLMGGGVEEEEVVKEEIMEDGTVKVTVEKKKPTPYDTLRKVLDDARYDDVRAKVTGSEELRKY